MTAGRALAAILVALLAFTQCVAAMTPKRLAQLRAETRDLFYHGYDNYMAHAFPEDEV